MERIAFADFEAVRLASGKSLVHNISIVTADFAHYKKWSSLGRGQSPIWSKTTIFSHGPRLDITIGNSLKNPAIELSENIQNKLRRTAEKAEELSFLTIRVDTLRDALRFMIKFIHEHSDGILMSHSLDCDLEFLFQTAEVLGEKRIFMKDFLFRPETRCYLTGWDKLTLVCTQRLLTTLCPKFDKEVSKAQPSTRLESYAKFVYGDKYVQSHTSVEDAFDLYQVMRKAFEYDHFKIDRGKTRLFMKPTSLYGRGQTFSSFHPFPKQN